MSVVADIAIMPVGEGTSLSKYVKRAVEELKKIFPFDDLPKYALRWILMDKNVSCVIPGASNVLQVEANSDASDLPDLTQDQMNKVKGIYEKYIMEYVQNLW
jgi:aryl-alcohol dehydrogenase-like predicted oxidoreductase